MTRVKIILGPPGTGKTTALLNILEEHLNAGTKPSRIGFISFTRKAAYEARDRAIARFDLLEEEVPYFRTIHSLAFRQLGLSHSQLLQKTHYAEIADKLGIELSGTGSDPLEGTFTHAVAGDKYLFAEGLSRIRGIDLRTQWEEMNDDALDWFELKQISESLKNFKREHMLYDFTDILQRCYEEAAVPELDVLIVDECQDLAPLQWRIVERLLAKTNLAYFAGDDDQAIYTWAGADVNHFIELDGERVVLDQSYRIPASVHTLASEISSRISVRRDKIFRPRAVEGSVNYLATPSELDLEGGNWLLLARSRRQLAEYERICFESGYHYAIFNRSPSYTPEFKGILTHQNLCKGQEVRVDQARGMLSLCSKANPGILKAVDDESTVDLSWLGSYADFPVEGTWQQVLDKINWEDAEYFEQALDRGEDLLEKPRIRISTIHGVKGGQADNVAIISDIYYRVHQAMEENPDNEHRVFYVGVTRTKENLHIIASRTPRSYDL